MNILAAPGFLWNLYVEYLWNYKSGSWVYSTASTFRVLAFLLIAPFVLLTLLDVTSYVIARTLGVIDDTKASTSETGANVSEASTPAIVVQDASTPSTQATPMTTPHSTYFRNPTEEEGNLQLSGVDMFSPAPSQSPSPTLSRRELSMHMHNLAEDPAGEDENNATTQHYSSRDSSSGESSFTMLDQSRVPRMLS